MRQAGFIVPILVALTYGPLEAAAQGLAVSPFEIGASGGFAAASDNVFEAGLDLSVVASVPMSRLWAVRTQIGRAWIEVVPVEFSRSQRPDTMSLQRFTVGFARYPQALRDYAFQPRWTMGGGVYRYGFRHSPARATNFGVYGELGMDFIVADERAVLAVDFAMHAIGGPGEESPSTTHVLYTGFATAGFRLRF